MKGLRRLLCPVLLCCLSALPHAGRAQIVEHASEESDLMLYTGFSLDKKVIGGFHLAWSEELRLKNRLTDIGRIYSAITASYQFLPWFKASIDYTFIAVNGSGGWEFRNRSNLDLAASWKPAPRWKLSLRERIRVTSANTSTDPQTEANPAWILRSRLMAEYSLARLPLKPFAYVELSNTLNAPDVIPNYIDKIRCSVGVVYAVSERSELEFYYRYEHNTDKEIELPAAPGMPWTITRERQNNHIIGIFYGYNF